MTCDSPPRGIAGLEQNLVSRFEWGLVTEIDPPDVDLRMAILRSKQKHAKMRLDDELLTFLAVNVTSNIRSLEGALLRAISFASFNGQPLTIKSMRHLLRDLINEDSQEGCAG
jgi:chromosomal replication initiator protein